MMRMFLGIQCSICFLYIYIYIYIYTDAYIYIYTCMQAPGDSVAGWNDGILAGAGGGHVRDGHVTRNIRLCLYLTDLLQPWVRFVPGKYTHMYVCICMCVRVCVRTHVHTPL